MADQRLKGRPLSMEERRLSELLNAPLPSEGGLPPHPGVFRPDPETRLSPGDARAFEALLRLAPNLRSRATSVNYEPVGETGYAKESWPEGLYGRAEVGSGAIHVNPSLPPEKRVEILAHEASHLNGMEHDWWPLEYDKPAAEGYVAASQRGPVPAEPAANTHHVEELTRQAMAALRRVR